MYTGWLSPLNGFFLNIFIALLISMSILYLQMSMAGTASIYWNDWRLHKCHCHKNFSQIIEGKYTEVIPLPKKVEDTQAALIN